MTDKALINAQNKRDSLAAEINCLVQRADELKRELAKIDAWIEQWHEFAGIADRLAGGAIESEGATTGQHETGQDTELKRRRARGNPKKEDVAEAAREIIQERGEPVSRAELFKALANRGVVISSEADAEMVLSTMLWRMRDKVVRLKTGGYWLPDKPLPRNGSELLQ